MQGKGGGKERKDHIGMPAIWERGNLAAKRGQEIAKLSVLAPPREGEGTEPPSLARAQRLCWAGKNLRGGADPKGEGLQEKKNLPRQMFPRQKGNSTQERYSISRRGEIGPRRKKS